ncbi:alpha/beta hydrolase [Aquibium sp. ELW1220]|uniref:alpha/beta hydrolase n=1 Tax=Aquibium sp. ELW1220 TaxID=2976766 RepID=UPI0025AEDD3F|nr:alpha/beta hydrolase [Aquibium sp. ELW1220]MDN2581284.1 alpha/beta hydrolase [Aquibium sp. ELW1220]
MTLLPPGVRRFLIAACASLAATVAVSAETLKPYKDDLFAYPGILESRDDGAYRIVDYREMRDINGRDEVPERRAHARYVSLSVRRQQQNLSLDGTGHVAVGRTEGARFITVYLHGQGGSRKQGVDDFTFGGNFNRIKNLMVDNDGLYLSPDFPDFGDAGAAAVAGLINHYAKKSPQAPVFIACGSAGGALCHRLAKDGELVGRLGGLLLLGSLWDDGYVRSAAFRAKVPLFIGQGSRDKVFPVDRMEAFYRSVRAAAPGYPIRMVRFESGTHGTPIRMTDWRETLNWMLSAR